ncbi:PDZ domain-containing protein [Dendrosporobacter sp. 1207_IL3150]|uniref:PDZ domain-containing protein n=1 Tax=Dendrosporobacter sp. 1207_IL3150 TaxID=3084054 RepID=UPI002FDA84D5
MFPWQDILAVILSRTLAMYLDPTFWTILALVIFQYWQMQKSQKRMFGVHSYSIKQQVFMAAAYGMIGGIIGSLLLMMFGVTLNQLGLNYIWPVAIVLMMINMRFLCFAYAGGLVAVSNVLFGWPVVNVPQVLALVAILHITESILIAISRRYGAIPLILKRETGQLVGAFNLQNFWPLPLVLLTAMAVPTNDLPSGIIKMPEWWPVIPSGLQLSEGQRWIYATMPVVAALGYADIAVASSPHKRRMQSAFHLGIYSVILLVLAILAARFEWVKIFAALASPLGHEYLIQRDNQREMAAPPRFVPPEIGVMVLDTIYETPARAAGLQPGDIITRLNDTGIRRPQDLSTALLNVPEECWMEFERDGQMLRQKVKFKSGKTLGVILVPNGNEESYAEMNTERVGIFDWVKRKFKR